MPTTLRHPARWLGLGFLLIALLGGHIPVFGQAEFLPGYLLRPGTDTLRGLIDYRRSEFNSRQCRFRPAPGAAVQLFRAGDLLGGGYGVGERRYEAYVVPPANDGSTANPPVADTLFLEVVERGPVSLLLAATAGVERYFIRSAGQQGVSELIQTVRDVPSESGRFRQVLPVYRGTLSAAFAQCPAEQLAVTQTQFKLLAIRQAVRRFNACVSGQPLANAKTRVRWRVDALAGLTPVHQLKMGAGQGLSETNDTYSGQGMPLLVGLTVGIVPGNLTQRWSFTAGLFYESTRHYEKETHYQLYDSRLLASQSRTRTALKVSHLLVPVVGRYTLPGKVRFYLEGGFAARLLLRAAANETQTSYPGTPLPVNREAFLLSGPRWLTPSLLVGIGIQPGRFTLGGRLESWYALSPYLGGSRITSLTMLVGYRLW